MATLLGQKEQEQKPLARSDSHYDALANDPEVTEFVKGTSYESLMAKLDKIQSTPPPVTAQHQGDILKSSGGALSEGGTTTLATDDKFGKWINSRWRPLMAVHYLVVCTADFFLFPILWSILQGLQGGAVTSQWMPITLQGGGLYHIALGAILGVAAYGRSQEKIAGKT